MRHETPACADSIYRPPHKLTKSPTQISPTETTALDIDTLEHGVNIDFEENFPHQGYVISKIFQG